MKIRNRILTMAGALLVAGATLALADGDRPGGQGSGPGHDGPGAPPGDCGHRGFGPDGDFRGGPMMEHREALGPLGPLGMALHRLDLTDEQRDRIHGLLRQQRDAGEALRDRLRAQRDQRLKEPLPVEFDEARVRARAEEHARLMVEMEVARARVASQVLAVLTPAQRDELQKMRDERRERFEERWGLDEEGPAD